MNASELYSAGRLDEAIAAMNEEVKKNPGDVDRRGFLAELLCFQGNLERADVQLETASNQLDGPATGLALFRQLIRAAKSRNEFYEAGHLPEFLGRPSEHQQLYLEASIHLREGRTAEADALLVQAEEARPHPAGRRNGETFDDLRDLDDLTASTLEVLTSTGKYYWIPLERVRSVELQKPARPRDLLWCPAEVVVEDGPEGTVFLPTVYAGGGADVDASARLGRSTDWVGGEGAPTRGIGLRTFLVGDEACTVLELGQVEFDAPTGPPAKA